MRTLAILLLGLWPASKKKNWLLSRFSGVSIDSSANICPVVLAGVGEMRVAPGARIDAFNVFRRLDNLFIDVNAEIGSFNWFSSAPFLVAESNSELAGRVIIGEAASITSRHFIEASGGIQIGRYATLAGVRSTLMTHGIDWRRNRMATESVTIGDFVMVGGNTNFVLGAFVPPRSIIAMGSTVVAGLTRESALYAGSPAVFKKELVGGEYFERTVGPVPAGLQQQPLE